MSEIIPDIFSVLVYFDLFDFPLTEPELYSYLPRAPGLFPFSVVLQQLVREELIFHIDGFYLLRAEPTLIRRRRAGEKKAAAMLQVAARISRWLARFPFVRGVAVSGSLSKHFADEHSDIDFFIITAAGRLWMARTILHLFKKLSFLVHREDYFCMNYFVDEDQLEIADKNIYTAIEVATLMPMTGDVAFRNFFQANRWTNRFLPNRRTPAPGSGLRPGLQTMLEKGIGLFAGVRVETRLMKTTARRWNQKTASSKKTARGHVMEMALSAHCSKPAASGFHDALMTRYERRLAEVLQSGKKMATG